MRRADHPRTDVGGREVQFPRDAGAAEDEGRHPGSGQACRPEHLDFFRQEVAIDADLLEIGGVFLARLLLDRHAVEAQFALDPCPLQHETLLELAVRQIHRACEPGVAGVEPAAEHAVLNDQFVGIPERVDIDVSFEDVMREAVADRLIGLQGAGQFLRRDGGARHG
jgi:hypothetical protein